MSTQKSFGNIALDITDILTHPRGQKVVNGLLSAKGMLYRTARGRDAIQIAPDAVERIKANLKIELEEGLDGTHLVLIQQ